MYYQLSKIMDRSMGFISKIKGLRQSSMTLPSQPMCLWICDAIEGSSDPVLLLLSPTGQLLGTERKKKTARTIRGLPKRGVFDLVDNDGP
jgi:hypothetical protein